MTMEEERYELAKELGTGNFRVARLVRDTKTGKLVAVKYIKRGRKIDENVVREIINHWPLQHPSIIRFKERIISVQCELPDYIRVSRECRHLLSLIFVANLSKDYYSGNKATPLVLEEPSERSRKTAVDQPSQSVEEIMWIIQEAKTLSGSSAKGKSDGLAHEDDADLNLEVNDSHL